MRTDFRKLWNISKESFILLYSGTIGKKQGLEIVCDLALSLHKFTDIVFLIVGEGVNKKKLVDLADKNKLTNIHFKEMQPVESLPSLLNCANVHLVVQKKSFADTVLPSKLITILSVGGVAIITANQGTELSNLVKDVPDLAVVVEPENEQKLIEAILEIRSNATQQQRIRNVARSFAVKNYDRDLVLSKFDNKVSSLMSIK
jgi:colanic acid biosynthesis glycosyl transferase WcaI